MDDIPLSIMERFAILEDPRTGHAIRHELLDIIVITLCAVICGADNWVEIEEFGKAKADWFGKFLELPNGIPAHDTFRRVFGLLDPEQFAACFLDWVRSVSELSRGEVVAIDGKTLRGCHDRGQGRGALHMVSAWATENRMALGQTRTEAHSNEITAIPELLKALELQGCTVTIDAMGCRKDIAQQVVGKGADYLLAVKANQGELHEHVKDLFACCEREGWMGWLTPAINRWAKATDDWNEGSAGWSPTQRNRPTWTPNGNGPAWARWRGSTTDGTAPPDPQKIPATTSVAIQRTRPPCWRRPEAIGASRTASIGCWTWPLMKTAAE